MVDKMRMRLSFAEALLVAEWVFGPYDTENDLRGEGGKDPSFRENRLDEANGVLSAVSAPTLAEAAEALRDVVHWSEEDLDVAAGRVLEAARRILKARPPFYEMDEDMHDVLDMESAARREDVG